jgi:transposase
MPAMRLNMRKTRDILRLRVGRKLTLRAVASSCGVSPATVTECVLRAKSAGLSWPLPDDLEEGQLEALLYPATTRQVHRPKPDCEYMHRELKRRGVTLQLLWQEYKAEHRDAGYQYTQYCDYYRKWRGSVDVVMRQQHRAGEKLFVDYAGMTFPVIEPNTGEVTDMQVFVATFGASNYTFAEIYPSQNVRDWSQAHIAAFEFFGGCAEILVPDNLKSGVTKPCLYNPVINRAYAELADHYGAVVIPARVRKPKDKAKVENGVLQVERWVLAPLRNQQFFSLSDARKVFREKLVELNAKPFSKLDGSRKTWFDSVDRPALLALPPRRFEHAEWKCDVGVNIDFHVVFEHHYYSVPHPLVRKRVDVRATDTTIEVLFRGRRVASHPRSALKGQYTTVDEHRPKSHRRYGDWSPDRLIRWAETFGPETGRLVQHILHDKPHPEQGFRSCQGLLRLGKTYGNDRLEAGCAHALAVGAQSYHSVKSILKNGLDRQPPVEPSVPDILVEHSNIRGPKYYN